MPRLLCALSAVIVIALIASIGPCSAQEFDDASSGQDPTPAETELDSDTTRLGLRAAEEPVDPPRRGADAPTEDEAEDEAAPALHLSGRVVDESGAPVVNAWVEGPTGMQSGGAYRRWGFRVRTDGMGRFEATLAPLSRLPATRGRAVAQVRKRGYVLGEVRLDDVGWTQLTVGGRLETLTCTLRPEYSLEGTVQSRGAAVPFAEITYEYTATQADILPLERTVWANRHGRYRIERLDPDRTVTVVASDRLAGDPAVHTPLPPVEEARALGEVATLHLSIPEPHFTRRRCRADGNHHWLPRWWSIRGRVVDRHGHPVAGAVVEGPAILRGPGDGAAARTDDDGRFEAVMRVDSALQASNYELHVERTGFAFGCLDLAARVPDLRASGELADVVVTLQPPTRVSGVVRAANGEPVADAEVWLVTRSDGYPDSEWLLRATTDDAGRYALDRVNAGAGHFVVAGLGDARTEYVQVARSDPVPRKVSVELAFPLDAKLPPADDDSD